LAGQVTQPDGSFVTGGGYLVLGSSGGQGNTLVFSSSWTGALTLEQLLRGVNLVVH
jgi:hypothetical protein